jgi:hypothetical protein
LLEKLNSPKAVVVALVIVVVTNGFLLYHYRLAVEAAAPSSSSSTPPAASAHPLAVEGGIRQLCRLQTAVRRAPLPSPPPH